MKTRIWAIVPAAGTGTRFGSDLPKQYHTLAGEEVILRTLRRLNAVSRISGIGVGLAVDDLAWPSIVPRLPDSVWSYEGGQNRSETVRNGLSELTRRGKESDWVLVHDSVRPCVEVDEINRLIDEIDFRFPGGLLATPVSDTIKTATRESGVTQTVSRENLWYAQTPQLFPVALLQEGLKKAGAENLKCTDDAQAIEYLGLQPRIVAGSCHNLKITTGSDLSLAGAIVDLQERVPCSE